MQTPKPTCPGPLRVLALDDSLTIRRLIGLVVREPDYELSLAEDGATGLEMLRREAPDVLLLDYMLPDMKGSELVEALGSHLVARQVKVIVMSGKGEDVTQYFEGFDVVEGYLHKPFKPDDLRRLLASLRSGEAPVVPADQAAPAPVVAAPKPIEPSVPRTPALDRDQLGAAAQVLFRALKPGLERIPAWNAERAGRAAAPFFASRLLTPAAVAELVEGLRPLLESDAPDPAPEAEAA